jgi:ATP-dependent Clp protease ATP-binding subunit ClpA
VIFHPLTEEHIREIVDLRYSVQNRLEEQQVTIELSPAARDWLARRFDACTAPDRSASSSAMF